VRQTTQGRSTITVWVVGSASGIWRLASAVVCADAPVTITVPSKSRPAKNSLAP
jgi:hypothetical protein